MLDKVEYTSEDIDSKLETILGKDNLDEKDISKIKSLYPEYSRYYECLNYANKHKINNYIFIDDTESHFLKKDRLILTNPSDGLVLADIFKLHTFFSTIPEFKQLTMFNNIEEIELTSI